MPPFWFAFQSRLIENFNGAIGRQMKQNRNREFRWHVIEGFDNVRRAFFYHARGKENAGLAMSLALATVSRTSGSVMIYPSVHTPDG